MKTNVLFFYFFCLMLGTYAQSLQNVPINGLQGFWSFSGNAKDISGNHRPGELHGVTLVEDRFGNEQGAFHFNGSSAYIQVHFPGILGSKPRAVSFWARTYEPNRNMPLVSWGKAGSPETPGSQFTCSFNYKARGATVELSGAALTFEANEYIGDGRWHHYIFLFNKEILKQVEIYQDGHLLTHEPYRLHTSTPVNTKIGRGMFFGAAFSRDSATFFKGDLDDVALYDRALSQEEILALYTAPDPVLKIDYLKWTVLTLAFITVVLLIRWIIRLRVNLALKQEKEKFQVEKKWYEQENRVLKAQMDPHFIFNALNSIQQFIIVNDNERAKKYLSTFSQLIRMQLESNTSENLFLAQEIEIIEKYLQIESLRFNHAFTYQIELDAIQRTSPINIPSFIVQPFIENAIHHGLLPKIGPKDLKIRFKKENEQTLVCVVDDNGVGRKNPKTKQTAYKKKSLGINFVQQRLAIISKLENYEYNVEVLDKEDAQGNSEGTRVIIKMPIIK